MPVNVNKDAVETAIRVAEIVFVVATLMQAAGAFSLILSNRRWQRVLVSEKDSERKQFELRIHELEARLAKDRTTTTAAPAVEALQKLSPAPAGTPPRNTRAAEFSPHRHARTLAWEEAVKHATSQTAQPVKAPPRLLTADEMQILVARLADAPPMHVEILLSRSASHAEAFADKLRVTLSEANWIVDRVVPDLATDEPHGLALMVPDWSVPPPGARVLADTLCGLRFPVVEMNGEDKRVGVLTIFIGPEK